MVWYSKVKGLTGFDKTTIIRCVAKNHLRHTEETQKKVMKILKKYNTHTIEIKKMIILSLQYHQKQTLEALMM